MRIAIAELYCGASGKRGFYNSQELGLARAFARLGDTPILFMPDTAISEVREETTEDGILIVSVPAKAIGVHGRYDWRILLQYSLDAVQVGADNQLFAPELLRFCRRHGIKAYCYLGIAGSASGGLKGSLLDFLYHRNLHAYRKHPCFAKTPAVAKALERQGISPAGIAPVGLDLSVIPTLSESKAEVRRRLALPEDGRIFLFVGRLDTYKHPMDALDAAAALPDSLLVMIGTGSMQQSISQRIAQLGLSRRVRLIEKLPNAQVQPYYKACDFFLNCNPEEIFGMSVLEAMYQGCTVVARHAPGPDFIIENGVSGYLADSPAEMCRILSENRPLSPETVRSRITEYFLWDVSAKRFRSCLNP